MARENTVRQSNGLRKQETEDNKLTFAFSSVLIVVGSGFSPAESKYRVSPNKRRAELRTCFLASVIVPRQIRYTAGTP
jgi:hypothetical protein